MLTVMRTSNFTGRQFLLISPRSVCVAVVPTLVAAWCTCIYVALSCCVLQSDCGCPRLWKKVEGPFPLRILLMRRVSFSLTFHPECKYCDMTPENRNSPLLDNGSLKHVSVKANRHGIIHKLFEVVISVRFAPSYKTGPRN
jgi:hypothetical protein